MTAFIENLSNNLLLLSRQEFPSLALEIMYIKIPVSSPFE